jgi:hypothetical protein
MTAPSSASETSRWDAVWLFIGVYPFMLVLEVLRDDNLAMAAATAAGVALIPTAGWRRSTWRHRILVIVTVVVLVVAVAITGEVVPPHHWYAQAGAGLGAALVVLSVFARFSQAPAYAPPAVQKPFAPARVWTAAERHALLDGSGRRVVCNAGLRRFLVVFFVCALVGASWLALYGVGAHDWRSVVLGSGATLWAVWCLPRAGRIELILDSEQITARNLLRTYRVPWARVVAVHPAHKAEVVLDLDGDTAITLSALTGPTFPRRGRPDARFTAIVALLGPAQDSEEVADGNG